MTVQGREMIESQQNFSSTCLWNKQLIYSQDTKNIRFQIDICENSYHHPLGKWWYRLLSLGTGNRRRSGNRYWKI